MSTGIIEQIYEAAVAAREGREGAAEVVVQLMHERWDWTREAEKRAMLLNSSRPADYYSHRVPA